MNLVVSSVRRLNGALHAVSAITVLVLMVMTAVDIAGRYFFARPVRGSVELTEVMMLLIVYLGFAYAEQRDAHVSVDLVYTKVGPRAQAAFRLVASVVGIVVVALVTWRLWAFTDVLAGAGRRTAVHNIPLAPIAYVAVAGMAVFLLTLVVRLLISVRAIVLGEPPPDDTTQRPSDPTRPEAV